MSRVYHREEAQGRYGRPEAAYEQVRLDDARASMGATLRGDYIGAPPDVLLELALDALHEREKLVADLLRHVPRKHEEKIKALDEPYREARAAIAAAAYLIDNARTALAPVEHPEAKP